LFYFFRNNRGSSFNPYKKIKHWQSLLPLLKIIFTNAVMTLPDHFKS